MRGRFVVLLIAAAAASLAIAGPAAAQSEAASCPWMNAAGKTPEQRADALVAAMTLDQKIHQVHQSDPPWMAYYGMAGHVDATPELCIPVMGLSDAGSGVAGAQIGTTTFPSGVAQAAMWNPTLERRFGQSVGEEAWAKGINVMLGPGVNIARTPLNGRNFEYMGEDPFLAGQTAAAAIRGIQSNPVLAQVKHYAANNQETDRMTVDSVVDERTLRELYLPAFEAAVKDGHAGSIMCSYNRLNGKYACENPELLDGYLRRDWGFEGFVTSDWGATHSTVESALAGMNLEMHAVPATYFTDPLKQAVVDGKVPMARLNLMVKQIFTPMFRFGLFDHPPAAQPAAYSAQVSSPEHRAIARRMAEEATVLLKNDGGLLPLDKGTGRTIGVIGYAANPVGASNTSGGGGSSKGSGVPPPVSPLEAIQQLAAARGDKVLYAEGSKQADVTAVATASDVAIVFAADSEVEGGDRADLGLHPGLCPFPLCFSVPDEDQDAMVAAAAAANPNTAVVVDAGAPFTMPWLKDVKSALVPFYSGVENGNAIAAVLYGEADPSGKLPQTFPKQVADLSLKSPRQFPGVDGKAVYSEGLQVGYRWFDSAAVEPLFPFGFGLSYTTFEYSDLAVEPRADSARVIFKIANTGTRAGSEAGQVYVGFPAATGEAPKQLKGFRKLDLGRGESGIATVDLPARAFSVWDTPKHAWVQRKGCYTIMVGGSSRDLPLRGSVPIGGAACGPTTTRGCASRRSVLVHTRGVRRRAVRSLTVYVNGKRQKVQRGSRKAVRVVLSGRAKGVARVRIVARTTSGRVIDGRTYHPCTKAAPRT